MDINDGTEMDPRGESSETQGTADNVESIADAVDPYVEVVIADSEQTNSDLFTEAVISASNGEYWAKLKVSWSWNGPGTTFTCSTVWYQALNNGETGGNVRILVEAGTSNKWEQELIGNANQNGNENGLVRSESITATSNMARITFGYKYDRDNVSDKDMHNHIDVYYAPLAPTIDSVKNVVTPVLKVTGGGGVHNARVVLDDGAGTIGSGTVGVDGRWEVTPDKQGNSVSFTAYQIYANRNSARTGYVTYYRAALTSPVANQVVPVNKLVFQGIAAPNTSMKVVKHGVGTSWSNSVNTGSGTSWQAPALGTVSFPSGITQATVEIDNQQRYTNFVTLKVLGYPVIIEPANGTTLEMAFTITGNNGLAGSQITLFKHPTDFSLGTTHVLTGTTWSLPVTLEPGPHSVVGEQYWPGISSGRGTPVLYLIRPEKPTLEVTQKGETLELSGTGYNGAKLDIHKSGDGVTVYLTTTVSNGAWKIDVPENWLPARYTLTARQSVSDGNNGRIYNSGWSLEKTFTLLPPKPTDVSVTANGQKPTFNGRGNQWNTTRGTCVMFKGGQDMRPSVPESTVGTDGLWTTTATADLPPGTYNLTARQWVNNLWSLDSLPRSLIIQTPPPVLTPITGPTGQRPQIKGTMWNSSKVVVSVTGRPPETATTTGTSFHLNATSDWAPGTYTVSVTAEFGGQTSTPSTQSLIVKAPKPQIDTSGPVPLIAVISGKGWPGCRVKIFTTAGNQELGADDVKTDGTFEITLLKQAPGDQTLFAMQYERGNPANASVESDRVAVKFGVPTAAVTVPAEGGRTPRVSTFSGTTTATSGTVELWLGNTLLADKIVINAGTWSARGIQLAAGLKAVLVYIRDGVDLSVATTRNVKVVPEELKIDSPLTGQNIGRQLWISGVGAFPGDQVIVKRLGAPHDFPPVTVDEHGHWTTYFQHNMTATNTIAAIARAGAGLDSDVSDPITPKLLHAPSHITQPQAGDRVGTKPIFAGLARPRATVTIAQWFNSAIVLATTVAGDDGYWEVQSTVALAEGGARVKMRDTHDAQHSEWRESERFEVKAAVADFAAPILDFPREGQNMGLQPVLSGRGLPGAKVLVYDSLRQQVLGEFLVARDGSWSGTLNKQFPPGDLVCSVRQQRDGVYSKWMVPDRTFKVIQVPAGFAEPVIIDPVNYPASGIEPNPRMAGTGFPGAVLKVYFQDTSTVIAETRVRANGHWETRCKSDLAEGFHQLAAQQELDGTVSEWSGIIDVKVRPFPSEPVGISPTDEDVSHNLVVQGKAMPGATLDFYWIPSLRYLGTATANADGCWITKLYGLPLGESCFKARAMVGGAVSQWTPEIKVNIHDFG